MRMHCTWTLPRLMAPDSSRAGELYPTEVRTTAHGFSAGVAKLGALWATIFFNYIGNKPRFWCAAAAAWPATILMQQTWQIEGHNSVNIFLCDTGPHARRPPHKFTRCDQRAAPARCGRALLDAQWSCLRSIWTHGQFQPSQQEQSC